MKTSEIINLFSTFEAISISDAFIAAQKQIDICLSDKRYPSDFANSFIYVSLVKEESGNIYSELTDKEEDPRYLISLRFKIAGNKPILTYDYRNTEGDMTYFETKNKVEYLSNRVKMEAVYNAIQYTLEATIGGEKKELFVFSIYENQDEINEKRDSILKKIGYNEINLYDLKRKITVMPMHNNMSLVMLAFDYHDRGYDSTGDVCSSNGGYIFIIEAHN